MEEIYLKNLINLKFQHFLEQSTSRQNAFGRTGSLSEHKMHNCLQPTLSHTLLLFFSVFMLPSSFCRDSVRLGLLLETQAPSFPKNSASISATCRDCVITECQLQWDRLSGWPHLDLPRPVNHAVEMRLEVGKHTVVEKKSERKEWVSLTRQC